MKLKSSIIALPALVVTALFLAQSTTAAAEGEEADGPHRPAVTQGNGGAGRLAELLRIAPLPDGARDALLRAIDGAGFSGQGLGPRAPSNGHGPRALCQQFAGDGNAPEPITERCHRPTRDGDGASLIELCRRAANADDVPERLIERCERLSGDHDGDGASLVELCRRAADADDAPERLIERCQQLNDGRDGFSLAELCRRAANADDAPERLIERCQQLNGDHDGPPRCDRASAAVDDTAASSVRRCDGAPHGDHGQPGHHPACVVANDAASLTEAGQHRCGPKPAFDSAGVDGLPRSLRPTGVTPAAVDPAVN